MERNEPQVWRGLEVDNHFWAFFYFCRKQGDRVWLKRNVDGTADLFVEHVICK